MSNPVSGEAAIAILARLVAFDTTSRNSNLPLIDWVENYLASHGVASERVPDASGQKASLYATIGPKDRGGYVLSGHTDVVPVDGQSWTSDPFTLTRVGSRLVGRGTCDMKGFLACCLAAVPSFVTANLKTPVHLAFSYDEEVGCTGVRPLLQLLAQRPHKPVGAVIGEPSSMQVVIGHKGKRSIRAKVTGTTAHSSLAPQAVNAVHYGARLVAKLHDMAEKLEQSGTRDALYDIAHSTAHVGIFKGGAALNIVPHEAELVFEFRTIGQDDPDALVAEVQAYARDVLEPGMRKVAPEAGISFDVFAGFPGLDAAPDAPIVTLAKKLAARNDHAKVAYGTEAGLFDAMAGIPSIICGPGSIEQAHKADEFIEVSEMDACCAFLDRLVEHCTV
ncbi:MAG: acetylornithine deacetylase [Bosea sp. (in: a-proteobacteria)]